VIIVSVSDAETELGAAALQAGALDIVRKPTALATEQLYELRDELVLKVRLAAQASPVRPLGVAPPAARVRAVPRHDIIVLGTSTGGPQAITRLLAAMPGDLPVPLLIALHIPAGYTEALAARLDTICPLEVREAEAGMVPRAGQVILARGGSHLQLVGEHDHVELALEQRLGSAQHAPSVDLLFESAALRYGARTLGVVLTGMGDDGLRGARAICDAGGSVLTESERSCVVYGMPRCVKEAGYSSGEATIEMMAAEILRQL
jgi:two-component system chemotaxis response regulator CheB